MVVKICITVIGVFILINHKRIFIQGISQKGIPTGCEAVSTVALLQYFGIDIDVDDFIENHLPCQDFYYQNGKLYGANPHQAFAGNPYKKSSLGCYPKVIMKALYEMKSNKFANYENLVFTNASGIKLNDLVIQYLDDSIPVLLWITIDLKEPTPGMQYYLADGSLYTWTKHEHCVILCGYDEENYYFMDPLADGQIVGRDKKLVELRYEQLGKYALVIERKN